ncbi:MAG: ABC transporter substrate-binding protein [Flavobacteriales bacterium]|nr:ABC transporter substrate-binding protein [Flavobacteriales bacterium]
MRLLFCIFLAFAFHLQNGVAQEFTVEKSDSTAKIEGEFYVIHIAQPKQTLFSIAKAYEVKLSRIAFDNPGVLDGLKLGQPLRILKSALGETKEQESTKESLQLDGNYVLYTVPKQQTLYAISKEYNTTIGEIMDANPELADGLKVGSTIRIPTPKIFGNKQLNEGKQEAKMEMVGLPDIIRKTTQNEAGASKSGTYNVSLLLPLHLSINDSLVLKSASGQPEQIYEKSEIALQFYEGFLLAIDTLKKLGYNVNLKVLDTENSSSKVGSLVEKGALKNSNLIIGPFYSKVFPEVSKYALDNNIAIVSPTIKGNEILTNNPLVFRIIPSDDAMMVEMGRYLSRSDSTNNLVLHYGAGEEQSLLWRFRQGLESAGNTPAKFPSYDMAKSGTDSLRTKLTRNKRNNLVILSNNQVKLAGLIRKISTWAEDMKIVVFAPNTWTGFKNLEIDHFDDLKIHMAVPFYVDYERVETQEFVLKFRNKFNAEPSSFAFRGYDVAMHFIRNLNGIKTQGAAYMESVEETGFQSVFGWKKLPDGGFENMRARMVDYSGLKLKLAKD